MRFVFRILICERLCAGVKVGASVPQAGVVVRVFLRLARAFVREGKSGGFRAAADWIGCPITCERDSQRVHSVSRDKTGK